MKPIIAILILLGGEVCSGQEASVRIRFLHDTRPSVSSWNYIIGSRDLDVTDHRATYHVTVMQPQMVHIAVGDSGKQVKRFDYDLFLCPGYDLDLAVDFAKPANAIVVGGKGSADNQSPAPAPEHYVADSFRGDTLPTRVVDAIKAERIRRQDLISEYARIHHPSNAFLAWWRINLGYYTSEAYFSFKENNAFAIQDAYQRNRPAWQLVQDSLFSIYPLDNPSAVNTKYYQDLVQTFILREKEHLWHDAGSSPESFFRTWYNADTAKGRKTYLDDMDNALKEKIVNRYFTGAAREYGYSLILQEARDFSNPQNVAVIYGRFRSAFPGNPYLARFQAWIATVKANEDATPDRNILFADKYGRNLRSLAEVLTMVKGKTVLVDMWGTWCIPCRQEIAKNGAAIHQYFTGKGLDYLYIANRDGNAVNWKKLISFLQMQGTHIMASDELTNDIMDHIKGRGYPTYFIIHKDGTFELSRAGYPMNRATLIKQLEAAL